MKKILGLDLGTTSVGWALVNEAESPNEKSEIIKLGVRLVPLTVDERTNFEKGKSITTNADRTLKRSMRRNLQRYKLRREALKEELCSLGWISPDFSFSENGPSSTFSTLKLRAKSATEEITLQELAKVLLQLNKKRGYKSSRKANKGDDGQAIDGMSVAKEMYDKGLTPGEYVYKRILDGKYSIPEFYKSDLKVEFDKIWKYQSQFHPELTDALYKSLDGVNRTQTWSICHASLGIKGIKSNLSGKDRLRESYQRRYDALRRELDIENIVVALQDINGQISGLSGLLSKISDRSKELYFKKMTVGQMLVRRIEENPNNSLKNIVFYRQDYLDEFEQIWSTQASYHKELNNEIKKKLQDIIIFYQRPLKSQKGLINLCEFESKEIKVKVDDVEKTKLIGPRVCPRSSPLFQEFKIWQIINNVQVNGSPLCEEDKKLLASHLSYCDKLKDKDVLKLLFKNYKSLSINYKELDGNRTMSAILNACIKIAEANGYEVDFLKYPIADRLDILRDIFSELGFDSDFLIFNSSLDNQEFEAQKSVRLWHLLYSYEGDKSASGNQALIDKIANMCSMDKDSARILASVSLMPDYGSLSAKAIKKILPHMKDGLEYSKACAMAGYRHSKQSLTKEEIENRIYLDRLEIIPRNALRNPVVEKILNQMVNVVNSVIDIYGKPDEIRIELARELKKGAKERQDAQSAISRNTKDNEGIIKILQDEFQISSPSKNDIVRYKLYLELEPNGFKTLYSNTYIPRSEIFSRRFEIEHIIPQARLFDDSFSNKTLETADANREKDKRTAIDYIKDKYGPEGVEEYKLRIKQLSNISKTKAKKLLMTAQEIPDDFIDRELRDSQYIASMAREMLASLVKYVVTTTGSVTSRLREDWQLVNVMRELNWGKYERLGMTYYEEGRDGKRTPKIKDWTKRNDHRHHAMDALTIAFTRRQYIQYLNHLNARLNIVKKEDEGIDLRDYDLMDLDWSSYSAKEKYTLIKGLQDRYLYLDHNGKYRFCPPMPLDELRAEAKKHIESILVSTKAKNKVCTKNTNVTKSKDGLRRKVQLTPRSALHNETIYGSSLRYVTKEEKVGASFSYDKVQTVGKKLYREALLKRLEEFGGDPKKAFTGKNSLEKNPIWVNEAHSHCVPSKVQTVSMETVYTIRKSVDPSLKLEKVLDVGIRRILQARLNEYGGDAAKAFSNLDDNPIWLNKDRGLCIKSVVINASVNPVAIRVKKGCVAFVDPDNNHHAAIYKDESDKIRDCVVSFYKAMERKNDGKCIIERDYKKNEGWEFLFTLKRNEFFVFPNRETGFNPTDYDLTDPENYSIISPNLYRVQRISKGDYIFRHHLDTATEFDGRLRDVTWKRIGPSLLQDIIKVRLNNIGQIVAVGEYD